MKTPEDIKELVSLDNIIQLNQQLKEEDVVPTFVESIKQQKPRLINFLLSKKIQCKYDLLELLKDKVINDDNVEILHMIEDIKPLSDSFIEKALLHIIKDKDADIVTYALNKWEKLEPSEMKDDILFRVIKAIDDERLEEKAIDLYKRLLGVGASLSVGNEYLLRWAAEDNKLPIVQYCIENHCDMSANRYEAIRNAINSGYEDIAQYLYEHCHHKEKIIKIVNKEQRHSLSEQIIDKLNDLHKEWKKKKNFHDKINKELTMGMLDNQKTKI